MMQLNIGDMERFLRIVNACARPVRLLVQDRASEDIRHNAFLQELLRQTKANYTKLCVEVECSEDAMRLFRFMLEDGVKPRTLCGEDVA